MSAEHCILFLLFNSIAPRVDSTNGHFIKRLSGRVFHFTEESDWINNNHLVRSWKLGGNIRQRMVKREETKRFDLNRRRSIKACQTCRTSIDCPARKMKAHQVTSTAFDQAFHGFTCNARMILTEKIILSVNRKVLPCSQSVGKYQIVSYRAWSDESPIRHFIWPFHFAMTGMSDRGLCAHPWRADRYR
jgi:hypothetical protein